MMGILDSSGERVYTIMLITSIDQLQNHNDQVISQHQQHPSIKGMANMAMKKVEWCLSIVFREYQAGNRCYK